MGFPASHKSNCHGAGCREVDMRCLKFSSNIILYLLFKNHPSQNTCEVVEPCTCPFSSSPSEAFWIVTTILVPPHSALVLGVGAPIKAAARISGGRPSSSFFTNIFITELKSTGSGIISALSRGTERRPESRALPRTAGSPAASHILKGVVRVAAGDIARVLGVCESVVKEVH